MSVTVDARPDAKTTGFIPVEPFDLVVFGATGDLALRKLLPALFHRWQDGQIPESSRIFVTARSAMETSAYLKTLKAAFKEHLKDEAVKADDWRAFTALLTYVEADAVAGPDALAGLTAALGDDGEKLRVFYLALPPRLFGPVCDALGRCGLKTARSRVVLEKPIGTDLASAVEINDRVGRAFEEDSIFRIDHYLGKETVQNLLILRFANSLFEPIWNSSGVDHVQITVSEDIGAGNRASYYDTAGALRDMVQNHLLQLLCLTAMEAPTELASQSVRDEKLKVLRSLRPITAQTVARDAVRAQYVAGAGMAGYSEELGQSSRTETFVALRAHIDNWRWAGVPFYLRTGKRMRVRKSEIVVQFKPVPHSVVGAEANGRMEPNRLVIRLQPDEGVKLTLMTKEPGPGGLRLRSAPLNLSYADTFHQRYPDAYERLLMAVVRGNLELFMHRDEVEAAWRWIDGIVEAWSSSDAPLETYPASADGPNAALRMLARDDREWYDGDFDKL